MLAGACNTGFVFVLGFGMIEVWDWCVNFSGLCRSGRPTYSGSWIDQVNWIPGKLHSTIF